MPFQLQKESVKIIRKICTSFDNDSGELINILHKVQAHFGYLPVEVQEQVAVELQCSVGKVNGIVAFYSFFTTVPKGKYPITICKGKACLKRGAHLVLAEFEKELNLKLGETSADGKFTLNNVGCVGSCGLAPYVTIGDDMYPRVSPEMVKEILSKYGQSDL